ncbi:hypothetical protein MMC11_001475, partial [Xylographa trunciseda]|nr:hypothetical protein [Xylographa trunciseda]
MSQLSREEASELIADVRVENGGISREDREATRPEVLRALTSVRRKLAGATKILVNNLYSKDTRFIYELIQNAEDNSYSSATSANQKPFLSFKLYPGKIIIDSNEDGFHETNVRAICSTGESTKADSEGYIGEKGIGFKSVFKVAAKVHIQSGPFSFTFEHMRNAEDDGLGMVTPMNEEFEELPVETRTRMTLTLLDNIDPEQLQQDFQSIPDTLLLFLRKLQDLTIEIYPSKGATTKVTYSKHEHHENGLYMTNLMKCASDGLTTSSSERKFHMVKREVRDLPYDAARVDKKQKSIDHATTILAFPLDENDVPVLEQQHVFAFLPLRRAGFNFLIQSDFVTQANREDVVYTPRNKAILAGVAQAFRDAVLQFCNHPSLRYQWMRYLPSDSISDEFWGSLWPKISDILKQTPVLRSWSQKSLYCPHLLQWLPSYQLDTSGEPLLADLPQEVYLSREYLLQDFQILQRLGTGIITWQHTLGRLSNDLEQPSSKWKTIEYEADWRTRMCTLLSKAYENGNLLHVQKTIKTMTLVPISDGRWVSAERLRVYFPNTREIPIPTDLGLELVHPAATENTSWLKLLAQLGVAECPPGTVTTSISRRYSRNNEASVSLSNSIAHLRYLYWYLPEDVLVLDPDIWLFNHDAKPAPSKEHLYFNDPKDEDNLAELFGTREDDNANQPAYSVHFLHPDYRHAVNESAHRNGKSWLLWLESVAGVRRNPQICAKGTTKLSGEFQYIVDHRSEKLLWILKRFWPSYEEQIESVKEVLQESQVLVEAGYKVALRSTFLPLPKLKRLAEDYCVPDFYFISMSPRPNEDDKNGWRFLERLEVGIDESIYFYMHLLREISRDENECSPTTEEAVFRLYNMIQKHCNEDLDEVHLYFASSSLLYIPAEGGKDAGWVKFNDCVWDGPEWLQSKRRLNIAQYHGLEALLTTILKVPNASQSDVLSDLSKMKEENRGNTADTERIYDYLWHEFQSVQTDEFRKELLDTFEKSSLVYIPRINTWFSPSACVWAGLQAEIPGKVPIASDFHSKKTFFTKALKVPEPSVEMYITALESQAKNQPKASKIQETMTLISCLGVTATEVSRLLETKIFPVRLEDGQRCFTMASFEFAIIDKLLHRNAFQGKISSLDFSLEEIRDTRKFLFACGLESRLTSTLVEEVTNVQGGFLDTNMTKMLRSKALALVRCATHYTTPERRQEPNSLFRLFKRASVFVSDSISRSMMIRLNGKTTEGQRSGANFHLKESEKRLFLYLPKDEVDRDVCLECELPKKLTEFLNITDPAAERVLGGVFRKQNPVAVERILDHAGVSTVVITESQEPEEEPPEDELTADGLPSELLQIEYSSVAQAQSQQTPSQRSRGSPAPATPNQFSSLLMPTSGPFRPSVSDDQEVDYRKILDNVISVARRRAAGDMFSGIGSLNDPSSHTDVLDSVVINQGFGNRSLDRNRRICAAGELYVFEYLKNLQLTGFDKRNWPSFIRDYVGLHDDYRNIKKWSGNSLAGLEYKDVEGQFTKFLIRKGYLAQAIWANARPHYYFEVKTTTFSDRQEPFFVTSTQFRHLQEMRVERGKTASRIYIILRLYSIGRGDATGLNVYVDPETERQEGRLDFQIEKWRVTPGWAPPGWAPSERPQQSEDYILFQDEPSNRNSATSEDSKRTMSSGGVQSAPSPPPPATESLGQTSKVAGRGKAIVVRLPTSEGPTSTSDRDTSAPASRRSESPPVGPDAGTSIKLPLRNASLMAAASPDSRKLSPSSSPTPRSSLSCDISNDNLFQPSSNSMSLPGRPGNPDKPYFDVLGQKGSSSGTGLFDLGNATSTVGNAGSGSSNFFNLGNAIPMENKTVPSGSNLSNFGNATPDNNTATPKSSGLFNPSKSTSSLGDNVASNTDGPLGSSRPSSSLGINAQKGSVFGQTSPHTGTSLFGTANTTSDLKNTASSGSDLFGIKPNSSGDGPFGSSQSRNFFKTSPNPSSTSTGGGLFSGLAQPSLSAGSPKKCSFSGQKNPGNSIGSESVFGKNSSSSSATPSGILAFDNPFSHLGTPANSTVENNRNSGSRADLLGSNISSSKDSASSTGRDISSNASDSGAATTPLFSFSPSPASSRPKPFTDRPRPWNFDMKKTTFNVGIAPFATTDEGTSTVKFQSVTAAESLQNYSFE